MSEKETKTIGQALSGELTANGLLNLFSYEPPRYKIPTIKQRREKKSK
jgi:hypothetical protein